MLMSTVDEIKTHHFTSPHEARQALERLLDREQPSHPGIKRKHPSPGLQAVFNCAADIPCSFEVRFRKRKQGESGRVSWQVSQEQDRACQAQMQWRHCDDCMVFSPSHSRKIRAKDIEDNAIAQTLVRDNPDISAKGLMDLLSKKHSEQVACPILTVVHVSAPLTIIVLTDHNQFLTFMIPLTGSVERKAP